MLMIRNEDAMMKGCWGEKRRRPGRHQDVNSRQRGGWGRGGGRGRKARAERWERTHGKLARLSPEEREKIGLREAGRVIKRD